MQKSNDKIKAKTMSKSNEKKIKYTTSNMSSESCPTLGFIFFTLSLIYSFAYICPGNPSFLQEFIWIRKHYP